jgi:hypothetical protein
MQNDVDELQKYVQYPSGAGRKLAVSLREGDCGVNRVLAGRA